MKKLLSILMASFAIIFAFTATAAPANTAGNKKKTGLVTMAESSTASSWIAPMVLSPTDAALSPSVQRTNIIPATPTMATVLKDKDLDKLSNFTDARNTDKANTDGTSCVVQVKNKDASAWKDTDRGKNDAKEMLTNITDGANTEPAVVQLK